MNVINRISEHVKQSRYHFGLLFFVCLLLMSLHYFGDDLRDRLAFYRTLIESGQWWRIYSSQWVHFTANHLWMNVFAAGAVLYVLFFTVQLRMAVIAVCVLPLLVGTSVWYLSPSVEHYRGFSAVIHGLITTGLLANLRAEPKLMSLGLLGITAKVIYEHSAYFDVMHMKDDIGSAIAVDAHLYGYMSGIVLIACFWVAKRFYTS